MGSGKENLRKRQRCNWWPYKQLLHLWTIWLLEKDCPHWQGPKRRPPWPCPICRGDHWKADSLRRPLPSGLILAAQQTQQDWRGLGFFTVAPLTQLSKGTPEPWVILKVEGKPIDFQDTGATFSVLLSNPGTPSTRCMTVRGVSGKPTTTFFSQPLGCIWGDFRFSLLPEHAGKPYPIIRERHYDWMRKHCFSGPRTDPKLSCFSWKGC